MALLEHVLSLLGALATVIAIIFLCYYLLRRIARGGLQNTKERHISSIDRVSVGQDRVLLVVAVAGGYYLMSSTPQALTILKELELEEATTEIRCQNE